MYAKQPFSGVESVVEYLSRYTHKIAISNHRIQNIEDGKVIFSYKDYKHGSIKKAMTLDGMEFIRRYSLHILPKGFVRIRHYGICSSSSKLKSTSLIKAQLPALGSPPDGGLFKAADAAYNLKQCPHCKKETMQTVMNFNRRGPPTDWKNLATDLLASINVSCKLG